MAGIFERLKPTATDRVSAHLFEAAQGFNATGNFTAQQILDALNSKLASPLAGAELTDMSNIATQMTGQATTILKLIYASKLAWASIAVENGVMTEPTFRIVLNIA